MNLGKIAFDPGHYHGANVDPNYPLYSEGTNMLVLGKMLLSSFTNDILTRTDGKDVNFPERSYRAANAQCNTLISIHSNYPSDGVVVFYSITNPNDKAIAEHIGQGIATALGIKFRGAEVRQSTHGYYDYYGMIRNPIAQNLQHVFIVEHGSHKQLANETQHKLEIITQAYIDMFQNNLQEGAGTMLLKRGMTNSNVKILQVNLNKLGFNCGSPDGVFGINTLNAVKALQTKYNFTVDGLVGATTLGKIDALIKTLDDKIKQDKILQDKIQQDKIQQEQAQSNDNLKAQVIVSNQQIAILNAKIQAAINALK